MYAAKGSSISQYFPICRDSDSRFLARFFSCLAIPIQFSLALFLAPSYSSSQLLLLSGHITFCPHKSWPSCFLMASRLFSHRPAVLRFSILLHSDPFGTVELVRQLIWYGLTLYSHLFASVLVLQDCNIQDQLLEELLIKMMSFSILHVQSPSPCLFHLTSLCPWLPTVLVADRQPVKVNVAILHRSFPFLCDLEVQCSLWLGYCSFPTPRGTYLFFFHGSHQAF